MSTTKKKKKNTKEEGEVVITVYKYCDPTLGCGEKIRIRPRATRAQEATQEQALDQNRIHYCTQTVAFVYTDKKKHISIQGGGKIPIVVPAERRPAPCIYCARCDMIHSALALCIEDTTIV